VAVFQAIADVSAARPSNSAIRVLPRSYGRDRSASLHEVIVITDRNTENIQGPRSVLAWRAKGAHRAVQ